MRLERISFAKRLDAYGEAIKLPDQPILEGRLLRMVGLTLEAEGLRAAVGRWMVGGGGPAPAPVFGTLVAAHSPLPDCVNVVRTLHPDTSHT